MRISLVIAALLTLAGCNKSSIPGANSTKETEVSASGRKDPASSAVRAAPQNPAEAAEVFDVLLSAGVPGLKEEDDEEVEARKKRRVPPAPLEWKITTADVLSNYYLREPSIGPVTWRGIIIGYKKREVLLDGSVIETWYQDSSLTTPLQGVRIVTTAAVDANGDRQIRVSTSNNAWNADYVISAPKNGQLKLSGTMTSDGLTTTVVVNPNQNGAPKPFHVHYSDSKGNSGDADAAPRSKKPQPPVRTPPVQSPTPTSPVDSDATRRAAEADRAASAERARKALESVERTREQIEQVRKTQQILEQVEAGRRAQEQVEAARRAMDQAEAARKAIEQADASRKAVEQAEAARRAIDAAKSPVIINIPH